MDDLVAQFEYQAQQTFRSDDANLSSVADNEPIFFKSKLPWIFNPNTEIRHMVVSNNVFILHLNDKTLQRRCLDEQSNDSYPFQEIHLLDSIQNMFLDPYGRYLVVSTKKTKEIFLAISSQSSLKLIKKPIKFGQNKNFILASLTWCNRFLRSEEIDNKIVALAAGTDGTIYEIAFLREQELYITEVYRSLVPIMDEKKDCVTGIYCDVKSSYDDNTNIFIVITTQIALYYYENQIDPTRKQDYFLPFFNLYKDYTLSDLKYRVYPVGNVHTEIQLFYRTKRSTSSQLLYRQFAWITGAGLLYTEIDPTNVQKSFLEKSHIINYQFDQRLLVQDKERPPSSVALTEFHCLMMFPTENQIRAICTVNGQIVMVDGSMASGAPVCYCRDHIKDQLWACTDQNVLRYTIKDERRDVWRVFMKKNDFQKAFEHCVVADDPIETARRQRSIESKHADHLYNENKMVPSATVYAASDTSFEDVTLKFLTLKNKEPLRTYLLAVLNNQKPLTDSTQITILTLWLIDLFLNELDELRPSKINLNDPTETVDEYFARFNKNSISPSATSDSFESLRKSFQYFLHQQKIEQCLIDHRSAVYDLLTSHGDLDDLILFAEHVKDYERVILLYLEREEYDKALNTLKPLDDAVLYYKYSPILVEKLPDDVIQAWKTKYKNLLPNKLLPAMIAYSRAFPKGKLILDFLTHCLHVGCDDKSIHNYLLSEYVKFDRSKIMPYLRNQKEDIEMILYDPRYALRLCIDNDLKEESVFLYKILNLHEEAVDMALQVNVRLAKECVENIEGERCKKLWLKIARHVITQEGSDLDQAMEILRDCELLKVEDILPLFPDFQTIDHFQKPIIKSLEKYNDRLEELRQEMDQASKSIDNIREDLTRYRTRCVATIDSDYKCSLCEQLLMLQTQFYIFSCQHYFHADCLIAYIKRLKQLDKARIDKIQLYQSKLASGLTKQEEISELQQELDDLVAKECAICGEPAIDNIDQPLDLLL